MIGETNHEYATTLAFLYSGGVLRELLNIPAEQSSAIAFNERGEIVVSTYSGYAVYSAGVTTPLPGGFLPQDIDNGGRIVGSLNVRDDEHSVWDHPHGAVYSKMEESSILASWALRPPSTNAATWRGSAFSRISCWAPLRTRSSAQLAARTSISDPLVVTRARAGPVT